MSRLAQIHTSVGSKTLTLAAALTLLAGTAVAAQPANEPSSMPPLGSGQPLVVAASEATREATGSKEQPDRNPMKPGANVNSKVSVTPDNMVDLHVKDENIASVLEMLSIQSRKNIIASKSVSGKVSADLYNVTFYEALDALLHVNGFGYLEQGNFLYVYTIEELGKIEQSLKRRAAKVIKLNYLNANDAAEFVKPMLSQQGEIKASSKTEAFAISDSAPVGKDDYALTATLVVIDYEENIAAIEKLLGELDTRPQQVLVEATVLQTTLTEDNAFGFDFSIISDLSFNEFAGSLGGPFGIVNAIRNPPASIPGSLADNNGTGIVGSTGKTDGKSTLKVGVVTDHITLIARLLDEVSDTTVLANPKLLTLNRQPARVLVGQRVAYLNTTATETSSTQSVEFLDTGVQLYFRPFVSNNNEIRMELKPQVSDAKPRNVGTSGGQQVTVPDEITQEVVTNVIVPDGMTVVLGGLFKETTITTREQVPGLGDLPVLGAAFRGQEDSVRREEIIFLVTPTIMNNDVLLSQGERALNTIDRVRAGARQGLLPFSRDKMTTALNLEAERAMRNGKFDEANWKISHSLTLNPRQPDAWEMRERLTGEREIWPAASAFDFVVDREMKSRFHSTPMPEKPLSPKIPWNEYNVPRQSVTPAGGHAAANTPAPASTPSAGATPPNHSAAVASSAAPSTTPAATAPAHETVASASPAATTTGGFVAPTPINASGTPATAMTNTTPDETSARSAFNSGSAQAIAASESSTPAADSQGGKWYYAPATDNSQAPAAQTAQAGSNGTGEAASMAANPTSAGATNPADEPDAKPVPALVTAGPQITPDTQARFASQAMPGDPSARQLTSGELCPVFIKDVTIVPDSAIVATNFNAMYTYYTLASSGFDVPFKPQMAFRPEAGFQWPARLTPYSGQTNQAVTTANEAPSPK